MKQILFVRGLLIAFPTLASLSNAQTETSAVFKIHIVDLKNVPVGNVSLTAAITTPNLPDSLQKQFIATTDSNGFCEIRYHKMAGNSTGILTPEQNNSLPTRFSLPAPNPWNSQLTLAFSSHTNSRIEIELYNIKGELVNRVAQSSNNPGVQQVRLGNRDLHGNLLTSGVYFYVCKSDGRIVQRGKTTYLSGGRPLISSNGSAFLAKEQGALAFTDLDWSVTITDGLCFGKTFSCRILAADMVKEWTETVDRKVQWTAPFSPFAVEQGAPLVVNLTGHFANDDETILTVSPLNLFAKLDDLTYQMPSYSGQIPSFSVMALDQDAFSSASCTLTSEQIPITIEVPGASVPAMQFYPDKVEGKPGDVVNWTIQVTGGNLPFTILPELNNDGQREPAVLTGERKTTISFRYDEPNIYVPFTQLVDRDGDTVKVYSEKVVGILPVLEKRKGVGLKLPTVEDPTGDYLKGMHMWLISPELFNTESGRTRLVNELTQLKNDGINLLFLNPTWIYDDNLACEMYPLYKNMDHNIFNNYTLSMTDLIYLIDLSHGLGIKVGLRPFFAQKQDYDISEREYWKPNDLEKNIEYQLMIKSIYGKFCEMLGIEIYCLDAENDMFSLNPQSKKIIDAVRNVYNGVLTDSPTIEGWKLYRCPNLKYYDILCIDQYNFFENSIGSKDTTNLSILKSQFLSNMKYNLQPFLNFQNQLSMFIETGTRFRDNTNEYSANRYSAILSGMNWERNTYSKLLGLTFWTWDINLWWQDPHVPRGFNAEDTLRHYFNDVLPNQAVYNFNPLAQIPNVDKIVDDFEGATLSNYTHYHDEKSTISYVLSSNPFHGFKNLSVTVSLGEFGTTLIHKIIDHENWNKYQSINFAIKTDGKGGFAVGADVEDKDGERWLFSGSQSLSFIDQYYVLSVPFAELTLYEATRKDGVFNLDDIVAFRIGFNDYSAYMKSTPYPFENQGQPRKIEIDYIYLTRADGDTVPIVPSVPAVRFYPDRTEIKPGETINWTVEISDGNPPFYIQPELNNDRIFEPYTKTSNRKISISYKYDEPNIYVPYVQVTDDDGDVVKSYSEQVLGVIPPIQKRSGVGIKIPTPEDPRADYLKGVQFHNINMTYFNTLTGQAVLKEELRRIRNDGVNMVVFMPVWFRDAFDACYLEPLYNTNSQPWLWLNTISLNQLTMLINWAHDLGLKVTLRYGDSIKGDYKGNCCRDEPLNPELYYHNLCQIKVFYAKLCEMLGVEMFCLDAENKLFSLNSDSKKIISEVRKYYTGALTDSPTFDLNVIFRSPIVRDLDAISGDLYPFWEDRDVTKDFDMQTLQKQFNTTLKYGILDYLNYLNLPFFFQETGAQISADSPTYQSDRYSTILRGMKIENENTSKMFGVIFWDWDPFWGTPHTMRDHAAEDTMRHYFKSVLPDWVVINYEQKTINIPPILKVIDHFEIPAIESRGYWIFADSNCSLQLSLDQKEYWSGKKSLKFSFSNVPKSKFQYNSNFTRMFEPQDWSKYDRFNFWINAHGIVAQLGIHLYDQDGDRFFLPAINKAYVTGWSLISTEFSDYSQAYWCEVNDKELDLKHITGWSIGIGLCYDEGRYDMNIDNIYLSRGPNDTLPIPVVSKIIDNYEVATLPPNYYTRSFDDRALMNYSLDPTQAKNGSKSLQFVVDHPAGAQSSYWANLISGHQSAPLDWSAYKSINFWVDSHSTMSDVVINLWDKDGDRFLIGSDNKAYEEGWSLISFRFADFKQFADKNDGILDLSKIVQWGIGATVYDEGSQYIMNIDDIYLSTETQN